MTENRSVAAWKEAGVGTSGKEGLQRSIKKLLAVMSIIPLVMLVMVLQV